MSLKVKIEQVTKIFGDEPDGKAADTVFSTLDLTSLFQTIRLYARHVLRCTRRRRFSRSRV